MLKGGKVKIVGHIGATGWRNAKGDAYGCQMVEKGKWWCLLVLQGGRVKMVVYVGAKGGVY